MPDYLKMRERVTKSIAEFGAPAIIRHKVASPNTPWNPGSGTITDYEVYAVITEYDTREIDGTAIRRTDQKALVSVNDEIEVTTNDDLVMGELSYNILNARPISPAGIAVVYELQVRR